MLLTRHLSSWPRQTACIVMHALLAASNCKSVKPFVCFCARSVDRHDNNTPYMKCNCTCNITASFPDIAVLRNEEMRQPPQNSRSMTMRMQMQGNMYWLMLQRKKHIRSNVVHKHTWPRATVPLTNAWIFVAADFCCTRLCLARHPRK